ncbi:hypothetical protein HO173_003417 [Letharia columbiana]|uniref:Uncharacterized protein n=1 Tax=Letharia columbiana TaxID=112416 RepID=A0A8H6L7K9_9LECA|nr:uncharacterized protein HO173_003417 [Letharia columbiana]KAF6238450.1 hypothetical protein HO173_003417 [Letharia columbiana]
MHDMPAWVQQSMVQQDACDATATASFPVAEDTWDSSSLLPAADLNHVAHDVVGTACLSVGDDEHVSLGRQPFPNSTSEAPAVSEEGRRGDAGDSGSARTCSCPVCLDLHTINWFSSKAPSPGLVPRAQYSCRLPACDWMARGLDGATVNRYTNALSRHEKSHFSQKGRFICFEEHC